MKYEQLTEQQQDDRLKQRQHQLETEHFDNVVSLEQLETLLADDAPDDDPVRVEIKRLRGNLETIEAAHAVVKAKRSKPDS